MALAIKKVSDIYEMKVFGVFTEEQLCKTSRLATLGELTLSLIKRLLSKQLF